MNGMAAMATKASGTLIVSMKMKATTAMEHCTRIIGAKVRYIWTERMSEFAREISCPRLDTVVERKRHPGEVLVEDVPQIELDRVRQLEEVGPRDVAEQPGEEPEDGDQPHVGVQRRRVQDERIGDGFLEDLGDPYLDDQTQEGKGHGADELHLVRPDDGRRALDPRL